MLELESNQVEVGTALPSDLTFMSGCSFTSTSKTIPDGIKVRHKYDVWYVPRPDITYVIYTSRSTSQHRMGARAPQRPQPSTTKRHPIQRATRTALQQVRNQQRHQNSPLRRLQQLVRSLRLLGPPILRRQERGTHQRRTQEMDRRGQTSDQRHP